LRLFINSKKSTSLGLFLNPDKPNFGVPGKGASESVGEVLNVVLNLKLSKEIVGVELGPNLNKSEEGVNPVGVILPEVVGLITSIEGITGVFGNNGNISGNPVYGVGGVILETGVTVPESGNGIVFGSTTMFEKIIPEKGFVISTGELRKFIGDSSLLTGVFNPIKSFLRFNSVVGVGTPVGVKTSSLLYKSNTLCFIEYLIFAPGKDFLTDSGVILSINSFFILLQLCLL
jgi:hypothetical protein